MDVETAEICIDNRPIKGVKLIGHPCVQRIPVHTIILLDTSGSMNFNSKLKNVQKSLYFLLKFLQNDYLSLISFNDTSEILLENIRITPEHIDMLHFTIDKLKAERGTNLSAALLNAKTLLQRNQNEVKTGIIILTDGHANEGITKSEDILNIVTKLPISITTIAYGEDHNADLLKDIATNGNGSYNMVNNLEQVATVFGDILGGLMTCVMQNVLINHSARSLSPYPTKLGKMTIGDIYGESETVILFEGGDITVEGVATSDYQWASYIPTQSTDKTPYYISYARLEIASILGNMSQPRNQIVARLEKLKPLLEGLIHPLVSLLKREITHIETEFGEDHNTSVNLQASAFFALGRGVQSQMADQLHDVHIHSPYANSVQRHISESIQQMTQSDPCEHNSV